MIAGCKARARCPQRWLAPLVFLAALACSSAAGAATVLFYGELLASGVKFRETPDRVNP
jgi:hypothetical protein